MVPWTESSVTIRNLRPNAAYDVNVGTVTSAGPSGEWLSFRLDVVITERDRCDRCFCSSNAASQSRSTLEAVPTNDIPAVVGGVIALILAVVLIVIIVIIVVIFVK